jgi:hypothetical protein
MLATEVLRWDLTVAMGLSAKNLVIYLLAVFIGLRMVIGRSSLVAAGGMQSAWIVLIAYAIFSWLIAALVIDYQGYSLISSGIRIKTGLVDFFIFFLVFLFGVQSAEEGVKVIKWILLGAIFANVATMLDSTGILNLGYQERISSGRVQGSVGEANSYAAFIILFLPGMVAAAVGSRGLSRLAWLGGAVISGMTMLMTASRGGLVGLFLSLVIGAWMYRHLVSYSRVVGWALGSLVVIVLFLSLSEYGGLLSERVLGQTTAIDATEASSGRTEIWLNMFTTMLQHPITFITGYGWDVYWSFAFRFSPHNHYFSLWFNLGLVGLICGSYVLFSAINRARRASLVADPRLRRFFIAFVFGVTAVCGALFFVELYSPWMYFWMYTGTVMRLVMCVEPQAVTRPVLERRPLRESGTVRDTHGWLGRRTS